MAYDKLEKDVIHVLRLKTGVILYNNLMLEQSIDPNIIPEVQGTDQYDLLPEAKNKLFQHPNPMALTQHP